MIKYLVTYPNGKQCYLESVKNHRHYIYMTASKFSAARIGWNSRAQAMLDLKESGATVKKVAAA